MPSKRLRQKLLEELEALDKPGVVGGAATRNYRDVPRYPVPPSAKLKAKLFSEFLMVVYEKGLEEKDLQRILSVSERRARELLGGRLPSISLDMVVDYLVLIGKDVQLLVGEPFPEPAKWIDDPELLSCIGKQIMLKRRRQEVPLPDFLERACLDRKALFFIEIGQPDVSLDVYMNVLRLLNMSKQAAILNKALSNQERNEESLAKSLPVATNKPILK